MRRLIWKLLHTHADLWERQMKRMPCWHLHPKIQPQKFFSPFPCKDGNHRKAIVAKDQQPAVIIWEVSHLHKQGIIKLPWKKKRWRTRKGSYPHCKITKNATIIPFAATCSMNIYCPPGFSTLFTSVPDQIIIMEDNMGMNNNNNNNNNGTMYMRWRFARQHPFNRKLSNTNCMLASSMNMGCLTRCLVKSFPK